MRAAEKAKIILNGSSPSDVPITKNVMSKVWINSRLAEMINFVPDAAQLKKAKNVE